MQRQIADRQVDTPPSMRRRILLYLTLLIVSGCRLDELHDNAVQPEGRAFSIGQAKEFFEKDFAEQLTKSVVEDVRSVLHPGDFTPQWDRAVYSESGGVAAYDVDILADRSIIAIRSKFGPNGAKAERLPVYQKLVVRRNVESGKMASYVLSLIPDVTMTFMSAENGAEEHSTLMRSENYR